jgi:phage replication initiation protein
MLGVMDTPFTNSAYRLIESENGTGAPAPAPVSGSIPPSGNTGGKLWTYIDPTTGEKFLICPGGASDNGVSLRPLPDDCSHPYSAITDYFNCTFQFDSLATPLGELFHSLFDIFGKKFSAAVDRQRGLHGYKHSFTLGESKAMFAYGGQAGTALLTLPGEACALVADWRDVVEFFKRFANAHITRWDGAVDDYEGTHTVDHAVACYRAGIFTAGGNAPSCNQNGNWIEPDGHGRTFYVGKRKNGKMLRVYEKGMQLGGLWHPWVRWEVELHNVDRVIPWEVLLEPGRYVVGCYPRALAWVQDEMTRIQTIKRQSQISYEHLIGYASTAYGPLLNVMLEVEGSADAVLSKLHRAGTPRRLQHPFVDRASDFIVTSHGNEVAP